MKKQNKGFTIVELVIVIAVIAILAAVLIPTFSNIIKKAQTSSDTQLIRNLNGALAIALAEDGEDKYVTASEAFDAVEEAGYNVSRIVSKSGYNIAYDSNNGYFVLLNELENTVLYPLSVSESEVTKLEGDKAADKVNYFVVRTNVTGETYTAPADYSLYCGLKFNAKTVNLNGVGFDAGENDTVTTINYTNAVVGKNVTIRTNGGTLVVNDTNSQNQQYHYGVIDKAVISTGTSCFHTYGAVGKMEIKEGKAVAEKGGVVYLTEADGTKASVEENGGKFVIPAGVTTEAVPTSVVSNIGYTSETVTDGAYDNSKRSSSAYEIYTLGELEQFRDLVNGGFSFAGCTVKLMADISLKDGWIPIGEGTRDVDKTKYIGNYVNGEAKGRIFNGEFDGGNHTINNLNNDGYKPKYTFADDLGPDGISNYYVFGFFGILTDGAKVHNIKFTNVSILSTSASTSLSGVKCKADSVGTLVGYISGNIDIDDITTESGNVEIDGYKSTAGGIIGRWYNGSSDNDFSNLTNKVSVNNPSKGVKVGGVIGFISKVENGMSLKLNNCHNNANITASNTEESYGDLMVSWASCTSSTPITFDSSCSASGNLIMNNNNYASWQIKGN